ncbi:MAG TPA: ATP-binding cassette domain-containing protein [Cytophagales bacterium]|nr:ATP-binding cassette domain-containing protein [Cytophagales bacterium]
MDITIEGLGKRYNYDWIFRNLNYSFNANTDYAIVGSNGSGKSTFVKILSSFILPTEGKIIYTSDGVLVEPEKVYSHIVFSAPYLELIEEFTLREVFHFHFKFKKPLLGLNEFAERSRLASALNKQIKFFSSGMKQRLKLGLSFFSDCEVLFLDEPTSNLDSQGVEWYKEEVSKLIGKKMIFICSNQKHEYDFCKNILNIEKLSF